MTLKEILYNSMAETGLNDNEIAAKIDELLAIHNERERDKAVMMYRMAMCHNLDRESGHYEADEILCALVEKYCPFGKEITKEYHTILKWYA